MDTLKIKRKQEEESNVFSIFYSKCQKKRPIHECPVNNIHICALCAENHPTKESPSFLVLRFVLNIGNEVMESINYVLQDKTRNP